MKSNYDKTPFVDVPDAADRCVRGWDAVCARVQAAVDERGQARTIVTIECYTGVDEAEIVAALEPCLRPTHLIRSADVFHSSDLIEAKVAPFTGGEDPIFGWITKLRMEDFLNSEKCAEQREQIEQVGQGLIVIVGCGASLIHPGDILIYADLARWEAQLRMRRNAISNLGIENRDLKWSLQYKRAYFIDWRVCDRLKRKLMARWDFVLDTNQADDPKLAEGDAVRKGLRLTVSRPFRVVPFFDPAPWGGQWMKEYCDLDREVENYGWCFDCVPEENSLLLRFGENVMELPSINAVFYAPQDLLGEAVHGRFGDEFPIRFDFLDTIGGGHLSFQVHPLTEYIQHHFGMNYTQDESYYILDAEAGAKVYLGLLDDVDPDAMIGDLRAAQRGEKPFDDELYVQSWPAKKHDHFLIPAGTCHCSGAGSMVLEISATPYIFTFKMWDWGRLGLDGLPRPINIDRAVENIAWERTPEMVERELVNAVEPVASGEGWREERTGLHAREFIETRRHWFSGTVEHHTHGGVNVLNLVEGREAIVESPTGAFAPYVVHYAETFIVPAAVGAYTIRPYGESAGQECATMKAYVRT